MGADKVDRMLGYKKGSTLVALELMNVKFCSVLDSSISSLLCHTGQKMYIDMSIRP